MESSSWPEHLHSHCKRAIQELIQGLEFTSQLQMRVCKPNHIDGSSMDDLVLKIKGSITESLSILSFCDSGEVPQIPASVHVGSPASWDGRKSEDSGESSKNSAFKDRRGSYKRRKTSKTYERVTSSLIDDGHAWRKYGQKVILNAKHPRNYYRCTHKFEQGCQATKQVQKSEDDPPMYRTTYHGHHTCRNLHKAPQIILDSTRDSSSILLSFESKGILEEKNNHPDHHDLYFPMIKHENYKEDLQCFNNLHSSSSAADYLMSPHPHLTTTFDSSELMSSMFSSRSDVISSAVSSSTTSGRSFEMDMMVGNVNFDDFQFEFCS